MAAKENSEKKIAKKSESKQKSGFRPLRYFKEVYGELKKVTWATRKELLSHTGAVFAFVIGMAIIIGILDLLFSQGMSLLANIGKATPLL